MLLTNIFRTLWADWGTIFVLRHHNMLLCNLCNLRKFYLYLWRRFPDINDRYRQDVIMLLFYETNLSFILISYFSMSLPFSYFKLFQWLHNFSKITFSSTVSYFCISRFSGCQTSRKLCADNFFKLPLLKALKLR